MAKPRHPEIQPSSSSSSTQNNHHTINLPTMSSQRTTSTSAATATRTGSAVQSIRNQRPSHFVLFIVSTITTLFNLFFHIFMFITTLAAFPLLLLALFVVRIAQLVQHGDGYDKAIKLKTLIRAWIRIGTWLLLISTGLLLILLLVLKHGFSLNRFSRHLEINVVINWCKMVCMISGVYFLVLSSTGFLYLLPRVPLEHSSSGTHVPESITEVIECLLFLWAVLEVMARVPVVGRCKLYGLDIERWVEVSILVLIAHDLITVSTHLVAWSTRRLVNRHLQPGVDTKSQWYLFVEELLLRQYLVYYTTGVRKSFSFILSSLLLLFTWVFYFGPRLDDKGVLKFGKWSCFSLVICSLLWLVKSCILLAWEARVVYDRLSAKILEGGEVLYFLGVVGRAKCDIFSLLYEDRRCGESHVACDDEQKEEEEENGGLRRRQLIGLYIVCVLGVVSVDKYRSKGDQEEEVWDEVNGNKWVKMSTRKRKMVRDELLLLNNGAQTVYNVQQVAQYILAAKDTLSKEKFISNILDQFSKDEDNREILEKIIDWKDNLNVAETAENSNSSLSNGEIAEKKDSRPQDWEYFEKLLKNVHRSEELSFLKLEAWMERAHNKCLQLANTLKSAKEVLDCLNKIMSGSIISATFIMWLLLTGLATTKVLVLIASPLLAATFIFGDTCKALFQGIIFIYVVHPFDVGDLCVVADKLRVVKAIGVWKTIFSKVDGVGTREEVIYPNSELAKQVVINHKTEFDWDNWDSYQEFHLGSWHGSNIEDEASQLKKTIEDHLKENEEVYNLIPSSQRVAVLAIKDDIKIAVRLKYKIDSSGDIQEWTYINCLQQKHKVQSQFDSFMETFVEKYKKELP
ncbi:uncharacterized protein LOC141606047 [Silene latifolia]|uniref:uncharacterized protein LOC141606047 n=1 Tax=Silene latifolia TaxID=37657 RepID=UPI003D76BB20